ncbi:hypothetical protein K438DRAFT_1766231 [Mycena galopus ATCC 62051]|nr:hypothetical protein K438DRAFT_1766231 [Mycena galopus ATCC 62051]
MPARKLPGFAGDDKTQQQTYTSIPRSSSGKRRTREISNKGDIRAFFTSEINRHRAAMRNAWEAWTGMLWLKLRDALPDASDLLCTVRYDRYPIIIDAAIRSSGDPIHGAAAGFVGTDTSTVSILARRVATRGGVAELVKWGRPGADDH